MYEKRVWTHQVFHIVIQEDEILKYLKDKKKIQKWTDIAEIMETKYGILARNGKQCRERYHNHLNSAVSKSTWSSQELHDLIKLHKHYGNRWATIARQMPNRTDNCVKNHFYSVLRKGLKTINKLIKKYMKRYKPFKADIVFKLASQEIETQMGEQELQHRDIINILLDFSDQDYVNQKSDNTLKQKIPEIYKLISSVLKTLPEDAKKRATKVKKSQNSIQDEEERQEPGTQQSQLFNLTQSLTPDQQECEESQYEMKQYSDIDYQPRQDAYFSLNQVSQYDHIYM